MSLDLIGFQHLQGALLALKRYVHQSLAIDVGHGTMGHLEDGAVHCTEFTRQQLRRHWK